MEGTMKRPWRAGRPAAVVAHVAALALAAAWLFVPGVAHAAVACRVQYAVTSQWNNGFTANLTLTNVGDPVNGWSLAWSFPSGQRVSQGWNATLTQSGTQVTAVNAGW